MSASYFNLVRSAGRPPNRAIQLGTQTDGAGKLWSAVAHTQWGDIPGKAVGGTCWFSFEGKEHSTGVVSWILPRRAARVGLVMNTGSGPPYNALQVGHQTDGAGQLWAAVAISDKWGTIPGKAKENTCWYPYNGAEQETSKFYWVCHQFN